jgi:predicted transcriptional regulator
VVDEQQRLCGAIPARRLQEVLHDPHCGGTALGTLVTEDPVAVYADEPLRAAVHKMAEQGLTQLPVLEREETRKLVGTIALEDALRARARLLDEEHRRERLLRWRFARRGPGVQDTGVRL